MYVDCHQVNMQVISINIIVIGIITNGKRISIQ